VQAVRTLVVASLTAIAIPASGWANCEIGGYAIHTIAGHKSPDPKRGFLHYSLNSCPR
jgi:hypothetical protein